MSANSDDRIHIEQLEVSARVGVTEEERAQPQRLALNLTLWPNESFENCADDLARTVDYAVVAREVQNFFADNAHQLIETVAEKTAALLLARFPLRQVAVEVRKFVLPNVNYVSVFITRGSLPR